MARRNLHAIVTHGRALLGYALAFITLSASAMAKDPLTLEQRKQTLLDYVKTGRDIDLARDRTICALHSMPTTVRGVEADGTPHPGTVPMCKTIITESLKRDRGAHLYINFAVTELTGKTIFTEDLNVSKILTNNEGGSTFVRIRDAAMADAKSYKTVRDRELPLTTALALDAGAFQGYLKPDAKIAPSQTDADIERTIDACYQENADISRKSCFLAGARFGQAVRRTHDAASR